MTKSNQMSRRNFLVGTGGAVLCLPTYLETFAGPCSSQPCPKPKRFVLFHNFQGTVLSHWIPTGTSSNFTLPSILTPLEPHKADCLIIGGLDNVTGPLMSVGSGHQTADRSLYTGLGFFDQAVDSSQLQAGGPSVDQVLAKRIQGSAPLQSLNLAITAGSVTNNYSQSRILSRGPNDPVVNTANPVDVYYKYLSGGGSDAGAAAALLKRRKSVLDAVLENFKQLKGRVSKSDQLILEAHATKVYELEQQIIKLEDAKKACARYAIPTGPEGYQFWNHEWEVQSANLHMDLLVFALSCGLTNVGSLEFRFGHSPWFPWLESEFGGPLINTVPQPNQASYDNWHGMVHSGRNLDGNNTAEPGLILGYRHYADMFALLLSKMKAVTAGPGQTLLDTSLVMWGSEYGDGLGHNTRRIPLILAGTTGGLPMGRWLNYFPPSNTDHNGGNTTNCVNEVYVALLQAFGGTDTSFGNHMGMPTGPLPGILS